MNKKAIVILVVLFVGALSVVGQEAETVNLSEDRTLGLGIQLDFPFGGLISARYWLEPTFALEGIVFLWGYEGDIEGTVTARGLYRIADAAVVDFYGAAGATLPFSSYGYGLEPIILSIAGGIEFGFRSAPSLAWNIEFGFSYAADGSLGMLFGTGIHFHFLQNADAD